MGGERWEGFGARDRHSLYGAGRDHLAGPGGMAAAYSVCPLLSLETVFLDAM